MPGSRNHQFHRGLLTPADAPITMSIVERLSHQVERYMRRSGGVRRPKEAGQEHREILDALKRGANKQASNLLTQHILGTRDSLLSSLSESTGSDSTGSDSDGAG